MGENRREVFLQKDQQCSWKNYYDDTSTWFGKVYEANNWTIATLYNVSRENTKVLQANHEARLRSVAAIEVKKNNCHMLSENRYIPIRLFMH